MSHVGWTDGDTQSWLDFFNNVGMLQAQALKPWNLRSLKYVQEEQEETADQLDQHPSVQNGIPEPLVCTTSAAADAWKAARASLRPKKFRTPGDVLKGTSPNFLLEIQV
jgi:hypothetical protein